MKLKDIISKVFAVDKVAHFGVCLTIVVVVSACFRNLLGTVLGMIAALVVGLGKEIYDKVKGGPFSLADLVADFIGCVVGAVCCIIMLMATCPSVVWW